MEKYTYLIINLLTVIVCFVFSFHPKIKFNKYFVPFLSASIVVLIPFVLWDWWFTKLGVWWFNQRYVLGIEIFRLPLEEWLFFICIPFSCVFTYYCIGNFFPLKRHIKAERLYVNLFILFCVIMSLMYRNRLYPLVTFGSLALSLAYFYYWAKVNWLGKFSVSFLPLLIGFFLVNGVLTGTGLDEPIVNYNAPFIIGFRLKTIPFEDAFYGFELLIWNVYFFKIFSHKLGLKIAPAK